MLESREFIVRCSWCVLLTASGQWLVSVRSPGGRPNPHDIPQKIHERRISMVALRADSETEKCENTPPHLPGLVSLANLSPHDAKAEQVDALVPTHDQLCNKRVCQSRVPPAPLTDHRVHLALLGLQCIFCGWTASHPLDGAFPCASLPKNLSPPVPLWQGFELCWVCSRARGIWRSLMGRFARA